MDFLSKSNWSAEKADADCKKLVSNINLAGAVSIVSKNYIEIVFEIHDDMMMTSLEFFRNFLKISEI